MKKGTVRQVSERIIITLIHIYQHTFSIVLAPCCRFYPSCSAYASASVQRFGIWKGSWFAVRRLLKCHPFHPGGYDPVPENPEDY